MAEGVPAFTPINLLTGFLGSGKTALLRRLLANPALSVESTGLAEPFPILSTLKADPVSLPRGGRHRNGRRGERAVADPTPHRSNSGRWLPPIGWC